MSRPPEHPGGPSDPWGGNPNPSDYPPPGYRPPPGPPPGYGPPPPGYGGPPPPPPGYGPPLPGYPAQPGYPPLPGYPPAPGQRFDISDAFAWAWNKLGRNVVPLIVAMLVYAVIGVVLHVLVYSLLGGTTTQINAAESAGTSSMGGLDTVGFLVLEILSFVYGIFVQAGFLSGALDLADGRPVSIGSFFKPRNFGNVVLAGALLAVIAALLDSLSLLPSFIGPLLAFVALAVFTFFALFTIAFATDRGLSPIDALKASFTTVRSDIGSTLLSLLVQALLVVLGVLACGVGVLVGWPLALLIQVYTYRRLSHGPIAPLTP